MSDGTNFVAEDKCSCSAVRVVRRSERIRDGKQQNGEQWVFIPLSALDTVAEIQTEYEKYWHWMTGYVLAEAGVIRFLSAICRVYLTF
jgi:hypothetical protein